MSVPAEKGSWQEITEEAWDRIMAVNVKGLWLCSRAVVPEFIHLCMARHNFEGTHHLGDVKAPTLVLIGEADIVGSNHMAQAQVLKERIPGAEMKVLKRQSHGFFWQAPEETNSVILDWVKKHSGR